MAEKPIFVLTHPRACSTAFERAFLTRRDTLQTFHEPFGDAFYFGPERLSDRYEHDVDAREASGFSQCTYREIFDRIIGGNDEGKRVFVKDMAQYFMPDDGKPATIAPSLVDYKRGVGTLANGDSIPNGGPVKPVAAAKQGPPYPYDTDPEPGNPTVVPEALLRQFHFTFLIRNPRSSVPSYHRCTIPPLDDMTGFYYYKPQEAGYLELRQMFDYLRGTKQCGPSMAGDDSNGVSGMNGANGTKPGVEVCVIDADDLLDNPYGIMEAYCNSTGLDYTPDMLTWDDEANQDHVKAIFEKWKGFHEDAIYSTSLRPRTHKKAPKTDEQLYQEWVDKYGEKDAKVIMDTVVENDPHYEYLKQFALKV